MRVAVGSVHPWSSELPGTLTTRAGRLALAPRVLLDEAAKLEELAVRGCGRGRTAST